MIYTLWASNLQNISNNQWNWNYVYFSRLAKIIKVDKAKDDESVKNGEILI